MENCIAERKLHYSVKGSDIRQELVIRIGTPYLVSQDMVDFEIAEGCAACPVEYDGLFKNFSDTYGADLLQALFLASDVDPFLKRLSSQYDFYFPTGEPYFDEESEGCNDTGTKLI